MAKINSSVVVAMSGGVDSSVALLVLKKQGFKPIGVSFKYAVWENEKNQIQENICCNKKSLNIAKIICKKLNVPYHILDCSKDFRNIIMRYFLNGFKKKNTPNPCLICNRELKFKRLFEFAKKQGAEYVATGHYARIKIDKKISKYQLLKAKDRKKDQSYFLCVLNQEHLKRLIFPVGNYKKQEVYQIAKNQGFDFFLKTKQSQDLCFVNGKSLPFYLEEKIGFNPGEIRDINNKVLGRHQGLYFYTIGQRKGIKINKGPWWVVDFDKKNNVLVVTNNSKDPALFQKEVNIVTPTFISKEYPQKPIRVRAKLRYQQKLFSAILSSSNDKTLKSIKLVFDTPQKAVTPGQWAVFYQGEVCLGGGVIL